MPTINTWISDDDYIKYLVVKQKGKGAWTEFTHNALNGMSIQFGEDVEQVDLIDVRLHKKFPKEHVPTFTRQDRQPIPKSFSARKKK